MIDASGDELVSIISCAFVVVKYKIKPERSPRLTVSREGNAIGGSSKWRRVFHP